MFNAIDKDRSGFIDVDELKATFTTLGVVLSDSDVRTMLKEANIKGDRIFYEGIQLLLSDDRIETFGFAKHFLHDEVSISSDFGHGTV